MKNHLVIFGLILFSGCSYFKKSKTVDADVIARVNDEYLYASDVLPLMKGLKGEDSVKALKGISENWVRKKLLLQKAKENIADDDISIAGKVEEYRETLLLYEYEKALINQKLNIKVGQEELNSWYEKLKPDFPLENDVFLLFFIKLAKDMPEMDKAKKWILKPKDEDDLRKLEGYCKEFASTYTIDKGMWYEKETVLQNFPLKDYDISSLSGSKSFREFKTDDAVWFIKIAEVIKKDEPSPLEFIKEKILKAIIEKRKLQLIDKVYDKIYEDGIQSKSFEILVK